MFEAVTRKLLSVDGARKWLSHVITAELAQIHLVTRMSPVERPEEEARHDGATATAWRPMAEHAPPVRLSEAAEARLREERAGVADLRVLGTTLAMDPADMGCLPGREG